MKIVEPFAVQDTFASELGRVDILSGGFARVMLCVPRSLEDGTTELRVAIKIVMPVCTVRELIAKLQAAGTANVTGNEREVTPGLH